MESDDEVELRQVLGPLDLMSCQEFGGGKIFEVLVIRDDINWSRSSFEVMSPNFEGFENGQEFLVMYIIVQLCGVKSLGVKSDRMYLVVCC